MIRRATFLICGGITSVGLAAAAVAKSEGAIVCSTMRRPDRRDLLRFHGASHVLIDGGSIVPLVRDALRDGVDKVVEFVGTPTLLAFSGTDHLGSRASFRWQDCEIHSAIRRTPAHQHDKLMWSTQLRPLLARLLPKVDWQVSTQLGNDF